MDNLIERAEDLAARCIPPASGIVRELVERIRLADAVAYGAARADIECEAVMEKSGWRTGDGNWYSVTGLRNDNGEQDLVDAAIAYLESRGLIERDADGLVRVLDELEGTG